MHQHQTNNLLRISQPSENATYGHTLVSRKVWSVFSSPLRSHPFNAVIMRAGAQLNRQATSVYQKASCVIKQFVEVAFGCLSIHLPIGDKDVLD